MACLMSTAYFHFGGERQFLSLLNTSSPRMSLHFRKANVKAKNFLGDNSPNVQLFRDERDKENFL